MKYPPLPDTLEGWARYPFTPELMERLAADNSVLALSPQTLPEAEVTVAALDLLIRDLRRRGFDVHVLPLFQLQRLVAKLALRSEGMHQVATLALCDVMDAMSLSAEASNLEMSLGTYWDPTDEENREAAELSGLQTLVAQVASRYAKGGQSMSMTRLQSIGRLSFISSGSLSTKTKRKNLLGNKQRDSLSLMGDTGPGMQGGTMQTFLQGGRASMGQGPPGDANNMPQWLLDAASDMAAGGCTAGGVGGTAGVFGASTGVGGGSGTAASQPIEISSGGLLHHVRSLLLLRPVALHDVMLRKAEHLVMRGHYSAARRLLHRAYTLARACDHPEAEARSLLVEAMAQSRANDFSGAIVLIQRAQRIGGDYDFWRETVSTYVHCRLSAPHTTTTDAREALQGGVIMFTIIARDDRAAEKDAMLAAAALKLQLSQLLLTDMLTMRANGVFNWKKHYDQAVSLCGQVMAALAAREAGIPHIEALLHQSLLQMEDPKPDKDMRPRYKKIERVLQQAEDMAAKFVTVAAPRDLEHATSLPVSRLLARVRLAMAGLRLMQARARDAHAAEDRNTVRPKYPVTASGTREQESVVVEFIDAMEGASNSTGVGSMMPPEDTALTLAISAAQLCNAPRLRARALLLAGQCLQYKYMITVPKSSQPWPPRERTERRRTVIGLGDLSASISSSASRSMSPTRMAAQQAQKQTLSSITEGAGGTGTGGQGSHPATPSGLAPTNQDNEEGEALELAMARAETYQGQAVSTLLEALEVSLGMDLYEDAEACAYEIARCYGRRTKATSAAAAQYLCFAQACKGISGAYRVTIDAQPPQSAEQLALKQASTLREELPRPDESVHYQRVQATLAALGAPSRLHQGLDVHQAKQVARMRHDASGGLPPDLRVISLYLSPDRQHLYFVALNIPDTAAAAATEAAIAAEAASAAEAAAAGAAQGGAPGAPKKSAGQKPGMRKDAPPPVAVVPRMAVVDAVPLEAELLDTLRGALRSYRRNAEKHIREGIAAAYERGITNNNTHLIPPEPAPKGSAASKAAKAADGAAKGAKGGKASKTRAKPPTPQEQAPSPGTQQTFFPPELNDDWEDILWRLDLFLSPFKMSLRTALPDAADTGQKLKVVLLLDPELTGLPFEALPMLQLNCAAVSRATSLHTLRCAMQLPSMTELEQTHQAAAAAAQAGGAGALEAANAGAAAVAGALSACAPPMFDMAHATYIVDARCESSTLEQASGPCSMPLIPWFKSTVLNQNKDWSGMLGSPGRVAPDADFSMLLEKANLGSGKSAGGGTLLFLGMGRFLSYVTPAVVGSLDLRGMSLAVLLDRVNNDYAHQKQVYLDNRKSQATRALESPIRTAELLLARGVRTVLVTTAATTASANCTMLQALLENLSAGMPIAEAAWRAVGSSITPSVCELDHVRQGNIVVLGAPNLVAEGTGGKTGPGGSKGKK